MPELLPPAALELIDLVGMEAAKSVLRAYGGQRLYIPAKPTDSLVQALGEAYARLLCQAYPSSYLDVPLCSKALQRLRNRQIMDDLAAGQSRSQVAASHRMTWRHVSRIKAQAAQIQASPQLDLFG